MAHRDGRISVCGLVPYPLDTTPSQRFRIEQWLPHLEAAGVSVHLLPFADAGLMRLLYRPGRWAAKAAAVATAFARRVLDVATTSRYDAVLIHRTACLAGPALLERLLPLFGRPVIFDFDDAIFRLHTTGVNQRWAWLKFPGKTAALCRLSSHVVVGNNLLAEYARQYCSCVTVVPSSVDTDCFRPAPKSEPGRRVVVGWSGSSTSQTHLELFAPMLRRLAALPYVELRVHSDRPPVLPGVVFVWRPWSPATEAQEVADFDVGIMPMPDDPWARGKCAMKALLYMAVGAPAVCSPVGTNCEVVRHGENGFLAATTEDWLAGVGALVKDLSLCRRMGSAGRRTVEEGYSMRGCAARFAQVIRETVPGATSGGRRTLSGRSATPRSPAILPSLPLARGTQTGLPR